MNKKILILMVILAVMMVLWSGVVFGKTEIHTYPFVTIGGQDTVVTVTTTLGADGRTVTSRTMSFTNIRTEISHTIDTLDDTGRFGDFLTREDIRAHPGLTSDDLSNLEFIDTINLAELAAGGHVPPPVGPTTIDMGPTPPAAPAKPEDAPPITGGSTYSPASGPFKDVTFRQQADGTYTGEYDVDEEDDVEEIIVIVTPTDDPKNPTLSTEVDIPGPAGLTMLDYDAERGGFFGTDSVGDNVAADLEGNTYTREEDGYYYNDEDREAGVWDPFKGEFSDDVPWGSWDWGLDFLTDLNAWVQNPFSGLAGFSQQWLGDTAFYQNWSLDDWMCENLNLGTNCLLSAICSIGYSDELSDMQTNDNTIMVFDENMGLVPAVHLEATKGPPISWVNGSQTYTIRFYKVTYYLKDPADNEDMTYSIIMSDYGGNEQLAVDGEVIDDGGSASAMGAGMIVFNSTRDYEKIKMKWRPDIVSAIGQEGFLISAERESFPDIETEFVEEGGEGVVMGAGAPSPTTGTGFV